MFCGIIPLELFFSVLQNTDFCFPKNIHPRLALCADEAEKRFHIILWISQILRMSRILRMLRILRMGSGLKWKVLGQSGRSREVKLDDPNDLKWTVLSRIGRSKRLKVDGLRKDKSRRSKRRKMDGLKR